MPVVREGFRDAQPTHDHEGNMIDDTGLLAQQNRFSVSVLIEIEQPQYAEIGMRDAIALVPVGVGARKPLEERRIGDGAVRPYCNAFAQRR